MLTVPTFRRKKANREETAKPPKDLFKNFKTFCSYLEIFSAGKVVPFSLYDYQEKLSEIIEHNYVTQVVKSRQLGFTQIIIALLLYKSLQNPAFKAVVISKTQKDTSEIAKRARQMLSSLVRRGWVKLTNDNLTVLTAQDGGTIYFNTSKTDATRGLDSVCFLFIDEAAFIENVKEIFEASRPALEMLGDDARIVVGSTPNGQAGWYYDNLVSGNNFNVLDFIDDVRSGKKDPIQSWVDKDGWAKFIVHWRAHPIYSKRLNYLEEIARKGKLDMEAVLQEYDLCFTSSSVIVFPPELIRKMLVLDGFSKQVNETATYYCGLDTNHSPTGTDYVVFTVLEHNLLEDKLYLVDWYRKRNELINYHIYKISKLIDKYKPFRVGVEVTGGGGEAFYQKLTDEYIQCPWNMSLTRINTSQTSKAAMIGKLKMSMSEEKILTPDNKYIEEEFLVFQKKENGRLEAVEGKHDDIVMSLAFANEVSPISVKSLFGKGAIRGIDDEQ